MKKPYFGDVNDYRKYGLLRAFGRAGLATQVVWMLTPDAGRSVLVYQHYPRERRARIVPRLGAKLAESGRFSRVMTIDAKSVLYLLGAHIAHWPRIVSCLA